VPLSADDHEAIRQLLARYNFAIDLGDVEGWADCFLPDGAFECSGLPDGSPIGGRHVGRDALVAYARTHFGINKGRARHWNWNLLVEGDGDEATMRSYLGAYSSGQGDRAKLRATGIYEDRLRRHDGRWLFAERHVTVDG
jgi:hypothetical protein